MKHNYAPETALFAGVAAASAAIATSEAEWTVDATDSASIERHVNALSEGLMRRLTAQGILPHRMELIYLLQDGDASDNRDALRRWITRQLAPRRTPRSVPWPRKGPHPWRSVLPACSQHAPDEHLLGPVAREALGIMAGLYWDLGETGNDIIKAVKA